MNHVKWNGKYLVEAVVRYNQVVDGLQKIVPLIVKVLDGAETTSSGIRKKVKEQVEAIIKEGMPQEKWVRCYLNVSFKNSLYIVASFYSPVDNNAVEYGEIHVRVAEWRFDSPVWFASPNLVIPNSLSIEEAEGLLSNINDADFASRAANEKLIDSICKAGVFAK